MKIELTTRGYQVLSHPEYLAPRDSMRLASQSSKIGDYDDSFDRPGSSFLWIGDDHHLNREEVAEFISYLQRWLDTGKFEAK